MFRDDNRGLAVTILGAIAILVISALLFIMLDPAISQITGDVNNTTTNAEAQNAITERSNIWGLILYYPMLAFLVYLIANAVLESRRP